MDTKERDNLVFGYESSLNYFGRIIKWLVVIIIILIIALVGTNLAWVIYENQFEEVETSQENTVFALQGGDDNTVVGGDMNVADGSGKD